MTRPSAFKALVADDLDAETGQTLVVVHRRGEVSDRGDAEITQDLRTDADFAPLLVAVGFRGLLFADGFDGNAGSTVAQIDQHAAAGALEMVEHEPHALLPGEEVFHDVGLV